MTTGCAEVLQQRRRDPTKTNPRLNDHDAELLPQGVGRFEKIREHVFVAPYVLKIWEPTIQTPADTVEATPDHGLLRLSADFVNVFDPSPRRPSMGTLAVEQSESDLFAITLYADKIRYLAAPMITKHNVEVFLR